MATHGQTDFLVSELFTRSSPTFLMGAPVVSGCLQVCILESPKFTSRVSPTDTQNNNVQDHAPIANDITVELSTTSEGGEELIGEDTFCGDAELLTEAIET